MGDLAPPPESLGGCFPSDHAPAVGGAAGAGLQAGPLIIPRLSPEQVVICQLLPRRNGALRSKDEDPGAAAQLQRLGLAVGLAGVAAAEMHGQLVQ